MRLLTVYLLCTYGVIAQTMLKYDNIETRTWTAVWFNVSPGASYTNAYVSGTSSIAILGSGNGTSVTEQNWYSFPNVTGLNTANEYEFRFRLGSYTFSSPTATTKGVDAADIIDIQLSRNGGVSYVSELRITGNSNATWVYQTSGTITHVSDGVFSSSYDVYQCAAGNNNGLSTGYSVIKLKIANVSQLAVDVFIRVNSAGEEWWLDNFELWQTNIPLPIELISFSGYYDNGLNIIEWQTASEHNNDYFTLEKSTDGEFWSYLHKENSVGNSSEIVNYSYTEYSNELMVYYRLWQNDIDGYPKLLGIIYIYQDQKYRYIIKVYNMLGEEVDIDSDGVKIILYSDGSIEKIF